MSTTRAEFGIKAVEETESKEFSKDTGGGGSSGK